MNATASLTNFIFNTLGFIFMLRLWFQYCQVDFYNPLSQRLVKFTQPVLTPIQRFVPTIKNINMAALLLVFLCCAVKWSLFSFSLSNSFGLSPQELPILLLVSILGVVKIFGEMIFYSIFIAAIGSWFSRGSSPLDQILYQLTAPFLNPIRRILPRTGMIDFAPMIAAFILIFANRILLQWADIYWAVA